MQQLILAWRLGRSQIRQCLQFKMAQRANCWCSRKKTVVATSTWEPQYIILSSVCKEFVWLRRLFFTIYEHGQHVITLFSDSHSPIKLAANEFINHRNEHIDISLHYVRDVVARKETHLKYEPTIEMVADLLTNPLNCIAIQHLAAPVGWEIMGRFETSDRRGVLM